MIQAIDQARPASAPAVAAGGGNPAEFDKDWRAALASGEPRWLSYPAARPRTQTELFERVKADQIDAILALHGLRGGRALEYACGAAGMGIYLHGRGFSVTALDLSPSALALARRNAAHHGVVAPDLLAGDVFRLPFADASFDLVMSYGLLEHFTPPQLAAMLAETNRALRPGGLHIVDIVHGRPSVRTAGDLLSFGASACVQLARGNAARLPALRRAYFGRLYESRLGPGDYLHLMERAGLGSLQAAVCRPFPSLALAGGAERAYLELLRAGLPLWRWYDRSRLPLLDALGWMYLISGVKKG